MPQHFRGYSPGAKAVTTCVQHESSKVALQLNEKKTKVLIYNKELPNNISSRTNRTLRVVNKFRYLGTSIESTVKDKERKEALAWSSYHQIKKIWNSRLSCIIKMRLLSTTVERVLLHCCETCFNKLSHDFIKYII